ncbi:MAG: efflux RND transporter periplasmic adaptor subunit [Acidobacteriota bacterium]|nr:MAG: efflux RND transporter periplasmic adaptor subunit [Acidobacteriota bacterium]
MSVRTIWKRIKKPLISLVIITAAGFAVVSVARIPPRVEEVVPKEILPVNVEVMEIVPIPQMPDVVELPGALAPKRIVVVPAELRGRIEKLYCEEGQAVEAGQKLAELDNALLQAEYERSKAQYEFDDRTRERSRELLERGVLNKSQVEEAEARAVVSRAVLEVARTNLERSVVYAPTSGVLNDLLREQGEYVSAGDGIAQIVEVDQVKVVIQIPEKDVQYLRIGARIPVLVEALSNLRVNGEVTYISEVADESTRTTRVEVTIDNSSGRLRGGLIAKAQIPRRVLHSVVMIPLSAVIPLEEGRIVYVANEGVAERRIVELGLLKGSDVQVVEGLQRGDLLITSGQRQVGPGQQIKIVESES